MFVNPTSDQAQNMADISSSIPSAVLVSSSTDNVSSPITSEQDKSESSVCDHNAHRHVNLKYESQADDRISACAQTARNRNPDTKNREMSDILTWTDDTEGGYSSVYSDTFQKGTDNSSLSSDISVYNVVAADSSSKSAQKLEQGELSLNRESAVLHDGQKVNHITNQQKCLFPPIMDNNFISSSGKLADGNSPSSDRSFLDKARCQSSGGFLCEENLTTEDSTVHQELGDAKDTGGAAKTGNDSSRGSQHTARTDQIPKSQLGELCDDAEEDELAKPKTSNKDNTCQRANLISDGHLTSKSCVSSDKLSSDVSGLSQNTLPAHFQPVDEVALSSEIDASAGDICQTEPIDVLPSTCTITLDATIQTAALNEVSMDTCDLDETVFLSEVEPSDLLHADSPKEAWTVSVGSANQTILTDDDLKGPRLCIGFKNENTSENKYHASNNSFESRSSHQTCSQVANPHENVETPQQPNDFNFNQNSESRTQPVTQALKPSVDSLCMQHDLRSQCHELLTTSQGAEVHLHVDELSDNNQSISEKLSTTCIPRDSFSRPLPSNQQKNLTNVNQNIPAVVQQNSVIQNTSWQPSICSKNGSEIPVVASSTDNHIVVDVSKFPSLQSITINNQQMSGAEAEAEAAVSRCTFQVDTNLVPAIYVTSPPKRESRSPAGINYCSTCLNKIILLTKKHISLFNYSKSTRCLSSNCHACIYSQNTVCLIICSYPAKTHFRTFYKHYY